jgi:ATP-dependent DNA helicase RecG
VRGAVLHEGKVNIMHENEVVEFKREYTADVKKEIIAFANSRGGKIYIGWDDGEILAVFSGRLEKPYKWDKFEAARSLVQDLTFREASEEFDRCGIEFGRGQMQTLGIIGNDGLYTNLGLLLSDQCPYTIKLAVFNGTKKGEFKTRKEMSGSLFKQMRLAFDFLSLSNNLVATVSGLDRLEQHDYPQAILREAMLNAIIHRDYSFSGSIIVNLYDDRMEFVSLGGLVPGLRTEDLFVGISQPRNEKLANVFYRLRHIEAYGTGLRLIMQHYEDFSEKPEIIATHGAFSLILPNMNYIRPLRPNREPKSQHKVILDYLRNNESITNETVQELLSVKQTRAYNIIREMVSEGLIVKNGSGRDSNEYFLPSKL